MKRLGVIFALFPLLQQPLAASDMVTWAFETLKSKIARLGQTDLPPWQPRPSEKITITTNIPNYTVTIQRPLSEAPRPRLILGCGQNRCENPHAGDDTITREADANPTIIGQFGTRIECIIPGTEQRFVFPPANHYQLIWGTCGSGYYNLNEGFLAELERTLTPGGFFANAHFAHFATHARIPFLDEAASKEHAQTSLRIISAIGYRVKAQQNFEYPARSRDCHNLYTTDPKHPEYAASCWNIQYYCSETRKPTWWMESLGVFNVNLVLAKPYDNGTYPTKIAPQDFPSGIEIFEQFSIPEFQALVAKLVKDAAQPKPDNSTDQREPS